MSERQFQPRTIPVILETAIDNLIQCGIDHPEIAREILSIISDLRELHGSKMNMAFLENPQELYDQALSGDAGARQNLGLRIKQERARLLLTQDKMARACGMTCRNAQRYWGNFESGKMMMKTEVWENFLRIISGSEKVPTENNTSMDEESPIT